MSLNGLNTNSFPLTLDGTQSLDVSSLTIGGQPVDLSNLVPYTGATQTIDVGPQNIKTTHVPVANADVVNKLAQDTAINNLSIAIAGTFLDRVTTAPQTVLGAVSYLSTLSADNLVVPETKEADLGGVVQVSGNYRRTESDAGVTANYGFGSITSSLGVYQSTTNVNFASLGLATVTVGKRYKININVLGDLPVYTSSLQLYASVDGINPTQSLGVSAGFLPSSTIFQLLTTSFVPQYQYIILFCINTTPTGAGLIVKWFGLEMYETGVELEKVTLPLLTASKVPILNSRRQLVASGTDSSKLQWLDNTSEDIQTALNNRLKLDGSNANQNIVIGGFKVQSTATPTVNSDYTTKIYVDNEVSGKLNLSGNNANQNIVIGGFKVQSTATPTVNSDYTTKIYVDNEIIGAGSLYLLKTGGTMTGDIVMGANKITSTATPTTDDTLTRKGYVDTQLALKANLVGPNTFSNTHTFTSPVPITLSGLTASRVLQLDGSGNVQSSTVTTTTLGFLDATSSVQNQLNAKANLTGGNTFSGDQVINSGSLSISSRLLGTPDASPTGNFWIGLRGSGSEVDRLAIGIDGNQTTGVVGFVRISKTLNLGSVTANRVLILDASNNVGASTVTPATLAFLDATSSVQTQLNGKLNDTGDTVTGTLGWSGANVAEWGVGVSKEANSGKIGYGWVTGSGLEIVGGGTTAGQRAVIAYDRLGVGVLPVVPFQVSGVASVSGNVGIGTTNPQSAIHINTSGTHQIRFQTSTPDNHYITAANDLFSMNANLSLTGIPNTGRGSCQVILQTPTAGGFIQFMTGSAVNTVPSERMRITGAGFVGIGTTDPKCSFYNYASGTSLWKGQSYFGNENTGVILGTYDNVAYLGGHNAALNAWTNIAIAMGGNVGIGTTSILAGTKLHVQGNTRVEGTIGVGTEPSGTRFLRVTRAITADSDWSEMISFENSAVGTAYTHWEAGANVFSGKSRFTIRGGTKNFNTLFNYFNLDSDGRATFFGLLGVSAGDPSAIPNNRMTIGSLTIGDMSYNYGGGSGWTTNTAGFMMECLDNTEFAVHDHATRVASFMYFQGGSVNTFTIGRDMGWGLTPLIVAGRLQCNGNVGIGTTNPAGVLDVFSTSADYTNSLVVRTPWSSIVLDNTQLVSGRKWSILSGGPGAGVGVGNFGIYDITAGAYRFAINSSGFVGIGAQSPSTILAIEKSYTANGDYSSMISFENTAAGGYRDWRVGPHVLDNQALFSIRGGTDGFAGATNIFNINGGTQAVGIGTTNPGEKLHVVNGDSSKCLFGPNTTWGAYLYVGAGTNYQDTLSGQVLVTNGNLHLDAGYSKHIYLGFYPDLNLTPGDIYMYGVTNEIRRGTFTVGEGTSRTLMSLGGGSNGSLPGLFGSIGAWPNKANGCLYTQTLPSGPNSAGMFVGYNSIGTTGYITSLAPSVAWLFIQIWAADTYIYWNGALSAYTQAGGWVNVSDEREKEDIQPLKTDKSLERVMALKPKHYRRKFNDTVNPVPEKDKEKRHVGFIAQEVKQSNPHCISTWCNEEVKNDETEDDGSRLGMMYNDITVHLVGAVQELYAKHEKQIDVLTDSLRESSAQLVVLTDRNKVLEAWARDSEAKQKKMEERMEKMASLIAQLIPK